MSDRCNGARLGFSLRCNGTVYRCVHCGATGCTQSKVGTCSEQGFDVSTKCLKCGTVGRREMIGAQRVGFVSSLMNDPN